MLLLQLFEKLFDKVIHFQEKSVRLFFNHELFDSFPSYY